MERNVDTKTREEFNKLSQQERLNLVGEKWFSLYNTDKEYGHVIERSYQTDADGKRKLLYERSLINATLPYQRYFSDLNVRLGKNKSGEFCLFYKKSNGTTFTIGTIPSGFLEEAYFFEFPKSTICEYIDEYSLDVFEPFENEYTDYRSAEEICKTKAKPKRIKWFDNPEALSKVNITIIGIAILITIINIICAIC